MAWRQAQSLRRDGGGESRNPSHMSHAPEPLSRPPIPSTIPSHAVSKLTRSGLGPTSVTSSDRAADHLHHQATRRGRDEGSEFHQLPRPVTQRLSDRPPPSALITTDEVSTVDILKQQVEMLLADVETRVVAETRLQSINDQLRERLDLFNRQNEVNLTKAEKELLELHQQYVKENEERRLLQQQLKEIRDEREREREIYESRLRHAQSDRITLLDQVQHTEREGQGALSVLATERARMVEEVRKREAELQQSRAECDYIKRKADEYASELRRVLEIERKTEVAVSHYHLNLKRKVLHQFIHRVIEIQSRRKRFMSARDASIVAHYRHVCRTWRRYLLICQLTAVSIETRRMHVRNRCWNHWRLFHLRQRISRRNCIKRNRSTAIHFMLKWERAITSLRLYHRKVIIADHHAITVASRRCFHAWFIFSRRYAYPSQSIAATRISIANHHYRSVVIEKAWRGWRLLSQIRSVSLFNNTNIILNRRKFKYFMKVIIQWRCYASTHRHEGVKMTLARSHYNLRYKISSWRCLFAGHQLIQSLHAASQQVTVQRTLSAVHAWRRKLAWCRRSARNDMVCRHAGRVNILGRCLRAWIKIVNLKQKKQRKSMIAMSHCISKILGASMHQWGRAVTLYRQEIRHRKRRIHAVLLKHFRHWQVFVSKEKHYNYAVRQAETLCRSSLRRRILGIYSSVKARAQNRRHRRQVSNDISTRRLLILKRHAIREWERCLYRQMRENAQQSQHSLQRLQVTVERLNHRIGTVDLENFRMIERMNELITELSSSERRAKEATDRAHITEQRLVESMIIQTSHQHDIERYKIMEFEWAHEASRLRVAADQHMEDESGLITNMTMEIQELRGTIEKLNLSLADREYQLQIASHAAQDAVHRLDHGSDDYNVQLRSAFEVATSLRGLLEDKEMSLVDERMAREAAERLCEEWRHRWLNENELLEKTVLNRDQRIYDLERALEKAYDALANGAQSYYSHSAHSLRFDQRASGSSVNDPPSSLRHPNSETVMNDATIDTSEPRARASFSDYHVVSQPRARHDDPSLALPHSAPHSTSDVVKLSSVGDDTLSQDIQQLYDRMVAPSESLVGSGGGVSALSTEEEGAALLQRIHMLHSKLLFYN